MHYLIAAIVLLVSGFLLGHHQATTEQRAAQLAQAKQIAAQADKASVIYQTKRAAAEVRIQTITEQVEHVIEKPVYRNVCLDADGVRLVNAASGVDAPGRPETAMRAASAAD